MTYLDNSQTKILANTLAYPEGPIYCNDGSILLVEIKGERLTRVKPDGTVTTVAAIPGGPNGAAVGPDDQGDVCIYICNDGGFNWLPYPLPPEKPTLVIGTTQPANYSGGKVQKINLNTGKLSDLFSETTIPPAYPPIPDPTANPPILTQWNPPFTLKGPDDIVFDKSGGAWISDFGKQRVTDKDITGVYYISPDGGSIRQAIYPLDSPNGIALSPDGKWLYVALTYERKILKYQVAEGGKFIPNPKTLDGSYLLTGGFKDSALLDSMAVDALGNLYVATMLPEGQNPGINGGITIVSPEGEILDFVEITLPDGAVAPMPSNICFGGPDMKTAYITCGASGYLISMPSAIPGLKLNFNC